MAKRACVVLAASALAGCASVFFQPDNWVAQPPQTLGVKYENVHFASEDKTDLNGYFFPSIRTPAAGTVVHFHGRAQNVTFHYALSSWLAREGFNVFAFDYRGYGESGGTPSMEGAVEDGAAALFYAAQRSDVDPAKMAVLGQDVGAALAIASVVVSSMTGIKALVLEDAFDSYRSLAKAVLRSNPLTWLFQTLPYLAVTGRYAPAQYIGRLPSCRLLFIHGEDDRTVPISEGLRLFERAPEPKEFWRVPAGHLEAFSAQRSVYGPKLVLFLKEALAQ